MKNNPFPIEELKARKEKLLKKTAKQWVEAYLNSEEGKAEMAKLNQETLDYMLYGKPTRYLNEELLDETGSFVKIKELSVEEIVDKYREFLTETDVENLKKLL